MNYQQMKRVFRRGGVINIVNLPTFVSLKEIFNCFPVGQRRRLRGELKTATSFIMTKGERAL